MKKLGIIRFALSFAFLFCSICAFAQVSGDKLFLEGQKFQQKLTLESQNLAIKKFKAAKVVYKAADKKTMCDNQIAICNKNILALKNKHTKGVTKKETKTTDRNVTEEAEDAQVTHVELSLSETRIDFKSNPKEGTVEIVDVTCNRNDFKIATKPEWVTVDVAKTKLFISVLENKASEERSGVVRIKCQGKEADIVINQAKASPLKSLGKIFKKKK